MFLVPSVSNVCDVYNFPTIRETLSITQDVNLDVKALRQLSLSCILLIDLRIT